jgi:preprotein translocase subunit YajC
MPAETMSTIIMFAVLILVFYFFLIRPENKKKKAMQAMRDALKTGDKIITIGGIVGEIVHIKEDNIIIETSADRVRMELTKWSISSNETAEKAAAKEREEAKAAAARAKKEKKK